MLKLRVVQAEFGDCLILEYGTAAQPRFSLIDGGPDLIYPRHLKGALQSIAAASGKLDVVMISHVDSDHIVGVLDLISELRSQTANGQPRTIGVDALWHNSFGRTIGQDVQARLATVAALGGQAMAVTGMAVRGIGEGARVRTAATALQVPINPGFPTDLVSLETASGAKQFGNLSLQVVGPTRANLDALKTDWEAWLDAHEDEVASRDPFLMANSDRSVPNLSSIMVLASAQGKRLLLTGDGRSDHLLQGLGQANLLDGDGRMHVDVLKLPHHGSNRNVTKKFFTAVTADQYVASANGRDDNPDLATLIWIVEAAKEQNRQIEIIATNRTPSTQQLLDEHDPDDFGYRLRFLPAAAHSMVLELAS
jgi:hypothetical protein